MKIGLIGTRIVEENYLWILVEYFFTTPAVTLDDNMLL